MSRAVESDVAMRVEQEECAGSGRRPGTRAMLRVEVEAAVVIPGVAAGPSTVKRLTMGSGKSRGMRAPITLLEAQR